MRHTEAELPERSTALLRWFAAFCSIVMLLIAAPQASARRQPPTSTPAAQTVTEIILERTRCYGLCPMDTLVLRADGTAAYIGKENTQRTGQFTGTFLKEDFEKLAQRLVSEGFFELKPSYGSPNVDTPTQAIHVVRGGERKSVVNNQIGGSAALSGMQRVIQNAASDIRWQPGRSGIRGVASWKPAGEDWRALSGVIILIRTAGDMQEFSIRTDDAGRFEIAVAAGAYRIEPLVFGRSPQFGTPPRMNPQQTVAVRPDEFSDASFRFDRATGKTTMADGTIAGGDSPAQK